MFRPLAAALTTASLIASPVMATATDKNERAYTLTLMCAAVAAYYQNDADITRTMDAARKMARVQNLSETRLSDDLFKMTNALGAELRQNPNAMDEDRAVCRKLGLVS